MQKAKRDVIAIRRRYSEEYNSLNCLNDKTLKSIFKIKGLLAMLVEINTLAAGKSKKFIC
jgi:hypothetical protein